MLLAASSPIMSPTQIIELAINPYPLSVSADELLTDVISLMSPSGQDEVAECVLITSGAMLVGIITAWDIVQLTANKVTLAGLTVAEIMSRPVKTATLVELQDPLSALSCLHRNQVHYLPVVDETQHLVGLITPTSIQRVLQPTNLLRLGHVADVMTSYTVHATPDTQASKLAQLMAEYQVSSVIIVDHEVGQGFTPVGLVTAQNILRLQVRGLDSINLTAQTIMEAPLFYLRPSDSLWLAYEEMQQQRVKYLVVCDSSDKLLGTITLTDILHSIDPVEMCRTMQTLRQSIRHMETEKVDSLKTHNAELERLVRARTAQFEEQAKCDRLLASTTLRIHRSLDLQEILHTTVSEIRQLLQTDRAIIYRLEPERGGVVTIESVKSGWMSMLGLTIHDPHFMKHWLGAYQNGRIHVVDDIDKTRLSQCHIKLLAQFQIRANLVVPILKGQQVWGLLVTHHCAQSWHWQSWEINLLQQIAKQVGIAIQQAELYQQAQAELLERQRAEAAIQKLNEELESKVEERTQSWRQVTEQLLIEIAERNQIEEQLRDAKAHLQAVLDAVPGLVSWIEADLRYLGVNQQLANLFQLTPEDFIGQDLGFLHQENRLSNFIRTFLQSTAQTQSTEVTLSLNESNSEYLFIAQKYNQNQAAVFVGIDITDRKQIENALQESETKFRNLVEQTNDWVWECDINLKFTYINPRVREITGYEISDLLEKRILDCTSPSKAVRLSTILDYFLGRQEAFSQVETQFIHKLGHSIDLEISGVPVFNAQGELQGYRGITRDITERKQVERDIRKALTKEKELNDLKTRFISMASHEFRTPLTTILASAESLERYRLLWTEEKKITCLKRIQSSVTHMTKLLNDVLILGKSEADKFDFQPVILDLTKLCQDIVEEMQIGEISKNQPERLRFSSFGNFEKAWIDEKLLRHILTNLLSNALKYSPPQTLVIFQIFQQEENVIFQIQDEGIGIPEADQKRLFETFYRASNVSNIPGTGLGLVIVQRAVEAHKGKIMITSKPGVGSTFTISLPLKSED